MLLSLYAHLVVPMVPNPGSGEPPPGAEDLLQILQWVMWIAAGICVLGIVVAGAMMAISAARGGRSDHISQLGWALAGCVVIGSASGIVGVLI